MAEYAGERLTGERLLERLAEIARELASRDTLDETLQGIVDLGREYVTGCEAASISFVQHRAVSTPVWSGQLAFDADQAQYRAGQGPCLQSILDHEIVVVHDLETEQRWPEWTRVALDLGVRSSITFRLFVARNEEDTMGGLNLYATEPNAFDARTVALGRVFASHAAVALKAAIAEAGLQSALASRDVVGQAKGILMEREHLTGDQALQRLQELADRLDVKFRVLADRIATSGEIPGES